MSSSLRRRLYAKGPRTTDHKNKLLDSTFLSTDTDSSSASSTSLPAEKDKPEHTVSHWGRKFVLALLSFPILLLAILLLGARIEQMSVNRAKSTRPLYTRDGRVCAAVRQIDDDDDVAFETFLSVDEAHQHGARVAHCGPCGQCSTMQDMLLMAGTTQTLTDAALQCSLEILKAGGQYRTFGVKFMEETVGFTPLCAKCWVDDIRCSHRYCVFSGLKYVLLGEPKMNQDGSINAALECDEKMCGPAFLECAGANRRRQGIPSDIVRHDEELCSSVDLDW